MTRSARTYVNAAGVMAILLVLASCGGVREVTAGDGTSTTRPAAAPKGPTTTRVVRPGQGPTPGGEPSTTLPGRGGRTAGDGATGGSAPTTGRPGGGFDPPDQGTSTTRGRPEEPQIAHSVLRRRDTPPEGAPQFDDYGDPTGRRLVGPAAPNEGRRGTTFSFRVSPDPASNTRTLELDLWVLEFEGRFAVTYVTALGVVSTNDTGGLFQLRTVADDPPGTYCVAARFPDSNCSEFSVT